MEPVLKDVEIVLVAEKHDLDLIQWLNHINALEGKSSKIWQDQERSLVDTSKFVINKLEQDFRARLKTFKQDDLLEVQAMFAEYVKDFPDLSYTAITFNIVWTMDSVGTGKLVDTFVADRDRFDRIFSGFLYDVGGLVYFTDNMFMVGVIIPPQLNDSVYVTFTYRSESDDAGELNERILYFTKAIENTRNLVLELLGG